MSEVRQDEYEPRAQPLCGARGSIEYRISITLPRSRDVRPLRRAGALRERLMFPTDNSICRR